MKKEYRFCLTFLTWMLFSESIVSQVVSTSTAVVVPGGTISVSFSGAPGNATDWIGLYPESAPSDRSWLSWQYTNGSRSGSTAFKAPDQPGKYNFRMFENDGYKLLVTGNTFSVQVAVAHPAVSGPSYASPGENITVTFSGTPGNSTDWIAIYPESAPSDRSWISWKYTNGLRSGSLSFNAPDKPGRYNFRMLANDGYTLLATGNTIIVQTAPPPPPPPGQVSVSNPANAKPGQSIAVTFSGAPGNKTDWIGIYPESAPSDRSWLSWQYTNGSRSGSMTFKAPDQPGKYNFRLFENDGYKLLGTGNTIVVQ